ncbi:MAG: RagB/SusD family nutrient uptake outer membrane protein [Prevotella sp.]|nr:RagB/SusD family nutrient uptake outer membrane protein [Prevotella sp.]
MKTNKSILSLIAAGLLLVSCDSYLDIQPKGELIPETAADYEYLLNHPQLQKAADVYPNYMTDDVYLADVSTDGLSPSMLTAEQYIKNLYTFDKTVYGESETDNMWTNTYARIYYYNVLIDKVMDATEATTQEKRSLRAEALMCRAFEYLNLVNCYARQYDPATAATDPGVPLILHADISMKNLSRSTVQQVYNQIMADLKEADPDLPLKPKHNAMRASKSVGLGMLARMYLYMGDYKQALTYANQSLEVNKALINLNDYADPNPMKAIGRIDVPSGADNPENIFVRFAPYVFGLSLAVCGSDELMQLFTPNDKRLQLYFTKSAFGIDFANEVWMPYIQANLAMSTPEMYLIAAECEARLGSKDRAMSLINTLRDNRIAQNVPLTASSNDEALKLVLDERRRELTMNGLARFIDLRRLNKETRFAKSITHVVEGKNYTLAPNDPKYVLPIPAKVLRFNPNMEDNPR